MLQSMLHTDPCRGDAWWALTLVLLNFCPELYKVATVTARNSLLYQQSTHEQVGNKFTMFF